MSRAKLSDTLVSALAVVANTPIATPRIRGAQLAALERRALVEPCNERLVTYWSAYHGADLPCGRCRSWRPTAAGWLALVQLRGLPIVAAIVAGTRPGMIPQCFAERAALAFVKLDAGGAK